MPPSDEHSAYISRYYALVIIKLHVLLKSLSLIGSPAQFPVHLKRVLLKKAYDVTVLGKVFPVHLKKALVKRFSR
jgi:hypothetical protein